MVLEANIIENYKQYQARENLYKKFGYDIANERGRKNRKPYRWQFK